VGGKEERVLRTDLATAGISDRHELVDVPPIGIIDLFARHDLSVVSMGRPAAEDPVLFEAAAAAGVVAATNIPAGRIP
jgi:hypothetical protein